MATYAKLIYNGRIQTVALMEGLQVEEVTNLLKTVFSINGDIVGIMAEKGLVIPISLVCRSPQVIPDSTCKILVAQGEKAPSSARAVQDEESESEDSEEDDEAAAQSVISEISQFLDTLRRKDVVTGVQHQLLQRLLSERSALLFAAYSVAVSANDLEYLTEICKDIASSLQSEAGRTACEAQDEVLQVCDQLYLQNKVTESQLLYLRHLTLIRDSAIANVYDEFQEHNSVTLFAKALYDVANSHPFRSNNLADDEDEEENEDDGEEDDDEDEQLKKEASAGLIGVVVLMTRSHVLSRTEAQVLLEMVQREDDYVLAAYELYLRDNNMEELQDTLTRCVRLEIRKRVTDIQERELSSIQQGRKNQSSQSNNREDDQNDDDVDDESSEDYESGKVVPSNTSTSATGKDKFSLEDVSLDSLLAQFNLENIWQQSVPDPFVQAVFIAVVRKHLRVDQARALCDLFHAQYDLVHAAWEVYVVQKDTIDFIDTVRRVVKDLDLDELRSEDNADKVRQQKQQLSQQAAQRAETNAERAKTAAAEARRSAAQAQQQAEQAQKQQTQQQRAAAAAAAVAESELTVQQQHEEVQEAKAKALEAIDQAKTELLKHSLDMMVKQGMVTGEKAAGLYARHLSGDKLTDAAIEAYAQDRDVNEFVDTLQLLANHTKEELDVLMNSALAKHAEGTENNNEDEDNEEDEDAGRKPKGTSSSELESSVSEAQAYLTDIALQQVEEIVHEMLKNDMISAPVASAFARLLAEKDVRLVDAYKQFLQSRNGTALVDSLLKIVIASVQGTASKSSGPVAGSSSTMRGVSTSSNVGSTTATANSSDRADSPDDRSQRSSNSNHNSVDNDNGNQSNGTRQQVLDRDDQKTIVNILLQSNALTQAQFDAICAAIDRGDGRVLATFRRYETSKEVLQLVQELQSLSLTPSAVEDDQEDDDDKNEDEEDASGAVEARFMQIIRTMALSELEQTALRLALAEGDPAIRNAIDQFRDDLDEVQLITAMKNAARAVIHRTLSSASRVEDDEEDYDEENEEDDDDDEDDGEDDDENDGDDDESDGEDDGDDEDDNRGEGKEKEIEEETKKEFRSKHAASGPASSPSHALNTSTTSKSSQSRGSGRRAASPERTEEDDDDDIVDDRYDNYGDNSDEDNEDDNDEEEEEDGDGEEDDGEFEEDPGRSLITPKSAREHVFPILVQELVKENIVTRVDGGIIMQQFAANNPVVSTALDQYDVNNDMATLVDSLQQMVQNYRDAQSAQRT